LTIAFYERAGFRAHRNEKAARLQNIGGVIFGLGQALMEATEYDSRWANLVTRTLADYHVPVNLDVPPIDVYFVGKPDRIFLRLAQEDSAKSVPPALRRRLPTRFSTPRENELEICRSRRISCCRRKRLNMKYIRKK